MHTVKLTIPTSHREAFSNLAAMSDDDYERLRGVLEAATPTDSPVNLEEALEATLSPLLAVDPMILLGMLVGLRSTADSHRAQVSDVARSVSRDAASKKLIPETGSVDVLQRRVEQLLNLRTIILTSKAFQLSSEYRDRL